MGRTHVTLAASPTSWGVDFADAPDNPPWRTVLNEIGAAGIGALELGPVGYLPADAGRALEERSLRAVGSFLFENLHNALRHSVALRLARRTCEAIVAVNGRFLVVIDRPSTSRAGTAGRPDAARRLFDDEWDDMVGLIEAIARIAAEHDLQAVVHPHAGSYLEFEDEIDHFVETSTLPLCLDTGHLVYAGIAPEKALVKYGHRVRHLHLKDVSPRVLDRVARRHLDFWSAVGTGVFCPLGQGRVDLPAVAAALEAIAYSGFATVEQDRLAGHGSPVDDLQRSLHAIVGAGIGSAPGGSTVAS